MKRFFSAVLLLGLLWGSLSPMMVSVFAQNQTTPSTNTSPSSPSGTATPSTTTPAAGSDLCQQILNDAKTPPPEDPIEGEIIVLLTESIQSNSGNIPCSRVIECLRHEANKPQPNTGKRPSGSEADALVIAALKENYSQCIIAGKDGLDLLNNYARLVYQWIAGIVGSVCILIIIVSGIQISIGGLSQDEVGSAKERISRSLIGLAVLFLSAFILYSINPIFFS